MKIIEYSDQYRDDMIFMVLEAKNALGRIPHLNEDLLDIQGNYLNKGDPFYLALSKVVSSAAWAITQFSKTITSDCNGYM